MFCLFVLAAETLTSSQYSLAPNSSVSLDLPILKPNSKYELRLSFLGTSAADIQVRWACSDAPFEEKLFFSTEDGNILGSPCTTRTVEIRAFRISKAATPDLASAKIPFFVNLEAYRFGMPESVSPAVGLVVVLLVSSFCWLGRYNLG